MAKTRQADDLVRRPDTAAIGFVLAVARWHRHCAAPESDFGPFDRERWLDAGDAADRAAAELIVAQRIDVAIAPILAELDRVIEAQYTKLRELLDKCDASPDRTPDGLNDGVDKQILFGAEVALLIAKTCRAIVARGGVLPPEGGQ